jgi:hypothetical protein
MPKTDKLDNIKCELKKLALFFSERQIIYWGNSWPKNYFWTLKENIWDFLEFGFLINKDNIS